MRFVLICLSLIMSASALADSNPTLPTNSQTYKWMETDSPKRLAFMQAQNLRLDRKTEASPNIAGIKNWLTTIYSVRDVQKTVPLDKTRSVQLVSLGLGQPTQVILHSGAKQDLVLYSNEQLENAVSNPYNITDFDVSPDNQLVAMQIIHNGSIDQTEVLIYDLGQNKLRSDKLTLSEQDMAWLSPTQLIFADMSQGVSKYDLTTGQTTSLGDGGIVEENPIYALYQLPSSDGPTFYGYLHNKKTGTEVQIDPSLNPDHIVGSDSQYVYVWFDGPTKNMEIRRFPQVASGPQMGTVLIPESNYPIRTAKVIGSSILLMVRNGADRWMRLYDLNGNKTAEFAVPNCCSIRKMDWAVPGKTLKFELTSSLVKTKDYTYDLTSQKWSGDPETEMLTAGGVKYTTEIVTATSHDGTVLPIRLTRRADIQPNKQHPVFIFSYGGFAVSAYLDPYFEPNQVEFLRRGGIIAGPGLRGGDEYGEFWHQQAMFDKKINTFYDLDATAKEMVTLGWTTVDKIISTGTSNGGLTVAATSLMFPQDFGLTIPISGVHDLLAKDRLDAQFGGWDYEYGSEGDGKALAYLAPESPVELARDLGPTKFLVFEGKNDTRVDMSHSLKLTAALLDLGGNTDNVHLHSFRNAGHWLDSEPYQNLVAWRADVLQWTVIFDQVGWTW